MLFRSVISWMLEYVILTPSICGVLTILLFLFDLKRDQIPNKTPDRIKRLSVSLPFYLFCLFLHSRPDFPLMLGYGGNIIFLGGHNRIITSAEEVFTEFGAGNVMRNDKEIPLSYLHPGAIYISGEKENGCVSITFNTYWLEDYIFGVNIFLGEYKKNVNPLAEGYFLYSDVFVWRIFI